MKKEIREVTKSGTVRVTIADERWYIKPAKDAEGIPKIVTVPSVTWIASHYPKGIAYYKWLADKGWNEAEAIKQAAGDRGSKVHQAIEYLISGKEVRMETRFLNKTTDQLEELSLEEYEAIMSFVKWHDSVKPDIFSSESVVFNDKDGYAGTVDLVCVIDGEQWIVDLKTGQYIWPEYELQVSAYKHAMEGNYRLGILQIGYQHNKNGFKFTEIQDKFDLFLAAKLIWQNECGDQKPSVKDYPVSLVLKVNK